MKKIGSLAAMMVLACAIAAPVRATTWDAVADFSSANPSGPWLYGFGGATSFTAYGSYASPCYVSGVACFYDSTYNFSGVPTVEKNTTAGSIVFGTVPNLPNTVLNVHPGADSGNPSGGNDLDSIVRFVAPTAGTYTFNGYFQLLDSYSNTVDIYAGSFSSVLSGPTGTSQAFSGSATLAAGGTIDFRVGRAGYYLFDSTALAATVTNGVPEPASWALMIAGFGMTGAAMRRRRAVTA